MPSRLKHFFLLGMLGLALGACGNSYDLGTSDVVTSMEAQQRPPAPTDSLTSDPTTEFSCSHC